LRAGCWPGRELHELERAQPARLPADLLPDQGPDSHKGSENYPERSFLLPYAGQEVLDGAQANAYALKIREDIAGMPYHGSTPS